LILPERLLNKLEFAYPEKIGDATENDEQLKDLRQQLDSLQSPDTKKPHFKNIIKKRGKAAQASP